MSSSSLSSAPGKCYKFTVANANEAARVIREQLGDNARVLSVRTIEASGLRGLFGSPKIEVIATVVEAAVAAPAAEKLQMTSDEVAAPTSPVVPQAVTPTKIRFNSPVARDLATLLRRAGFSEAVLTRLQRSAEWSKLQALPLHRALVETSRTLQRIAGERRELAPLTRAAFIGPAGSGRTTSLCKWIGSDVSRRARTGHVVAVEFDQPLSRGPLPIFCEALGVPFAHFPVSTQPATANAFVYFDLPPMSLRDANANQALAAFLDGEKIAQRVLVLNAMYSPEALRAAYARGRELGATHVVFTHLDERAQWGMLWDYLLDGGLEPLFLATGASLTGECETDAFDALARRTLPAAPEANEGSDETEEDAA